MNHSHAPTGGEKCRVDPDIEALQRAASRAEEAASRVEQHGVIHGSLRTGQANFPGSAPMLGHGSISEVKEPRILDHNQAALRAEETAASVHAMVHQSMHTGTEFAVASRRNTADVDQFFRVGVDRRSDSGPTPRAEWKAESATLQLGSHTNSKLGAGKTASGNEPIRQPPDINIVPKSDQSLQGPVLLTPDDSCEDSSEQHHSEPLLSSFGSESRGPHMTDISTFEHTAVPASNTGNSSSSRGRPRKQNFIDRLVRASEQPSPEAPAMPRKRGRPRGSKSSTYTRESTEKLRNGQKVSSLPAGQNSQASSSGPAISQGSLIGSSVSPTIQRLPLRELTGPENFTDDASNVSGPVQCRSTSTSPTGTALVSGFSAIKAPSVTGSQAQLARENILLKTMFKTEIGPIMDNVMKSYESRLPRDVLIAVGKAVSVPSRIEV